MSGAGGKGAAGRNTSASLDVRARRFLSVRLARHEAKLSWRGFGYLLAAGWMVGGAGCQAPPRDTQGRGVGNVAITDVRGRLEFLARLRDQEQDSKVRRDKQSSKESIFEENVQLETDGSVYHPNFLEFTLAGLFGLQQHDFEETFGERKRTSGDDGDVIEYDFEGHFLKKKPYPGMVYAREYRSIEPRPFLSSLETTTTNYGFVWQYVDPKTPTSLQFNHTDVLLEPIDQHDELSHQTNEELRFETAYKFSEHNVLSFIYDRQSVKEEPFILDYDSDEGTLAHRLDFGDRNQHRLDSELNMFNQSGTFDIERTRFREVLRLSHNESWRSWYQFEFLDRTQGFQAGVPPIGEQSTYLTGTVEHKLYESLVSQFFAYVQEQDYDSGLNISRLGMAPNLDYRKKNPWGVLRANYIFRAQTEEREGSGQNLEVVDERATFRDPEPVVLANTNVQLGSIQITAEDRLTLYRSSEDYRVRNVGDRVEIERVPTGRILDGQTVLIDYIWLLAGDYTLDTVAHNLAVRQDFKFGLSPYYRLRDQDQDVTPQSATGVVPEDITANIYGVEYQKGPLRLIAEYEDHDSTIVPYEAVRLSSELTHKFDSGGTARFKARWTDMQRSAPQNRDTEFFTIEGRYRQTLAKTLTVEGAVLYRTEEDTLSGDDEGVDVDLTLEWWYRQTEVRVTYEFGRFEDDFAENRNQSLYEQFRRRF